MALVSRESLQEQVVGSSSPVQQALRLIERIVGGMPVPDAGEGARSASQMIANHLLHLFHGAGALNLLGHHSPVVALFRQMEDALDCFLAVCLVRGAAGKWENDDLKASEAAALVDQHFGGEQLRLSTGGTTTWGEYRKALRQRFNMLAHCSPGLTEYNLGLVPAGDRYKVDLVLPGDASDRNAHQLDAFLTAHMGEMLQAMLWSHQAHLVHNSDLRLQIENLVEEVRRVMNDHELHRCHDMTGPAELRGLDP